jgi:hypothetical protein
MKQMKNKGNIGESAENLAMAHTYVADFADSCETGLCWYFERNTTTRSHHPN